MFQPTAVDRERLLRIAQAASREIEEELVRIRRPVSAVLVWLSVQEDRVVGMDIFGHPVLLDELARHDPAIDGERSAKGASRLVRMSVNLVPHGAPTVSDDPVAETRAQLPLS